MSKKYLEIGEHGLNGDFYHDATDDRGSFRADNLEIATKIAFNKFLRDFDNLWREMTLVSIVPGKFTVLVDDLTDDPRHINGKSRTETHTVEYYGPADMYTIEYEMDHCTEPEYHKMLTAMNIAAENNHPAVRIGRRTGRVMFAISFPRWRPDVPTNASIDKRWWPAEHSYLSTDITLARLQMQYAEINY